MKLPDGKFYLFGMGNRRKMVYKDGKILDALSSEIIRSWDIIYEEIMPSEYRVCLVEKDGCSIEITEDETGVWVEENGQREGLTEGKIVLPRFEGCNYSKVLRILHHEILINIIDGKPVPNFFVYRKPWYRDAAMMCMCLEKTGNLPLVKNWIIGMREPFDRNNAGNMEPDNLGQTLYLISLVSDATHPLVQIVLNEVERFQKDNYVIGLSDFAEHPVYQTKWLKFGLAKLGLVDSFKIPTVYDSYSALFWMEYRSTHVNGLNFNEQDRELYPYLGWAEAHFYGWEPSFQLLNDSYPLTWEAEASQADYHGINPILKDYAARKISAPHTWHASEAFLYLLEK